MASQEEDNKLECKSNVNKEQERNFVNVYKKYEYILNSKNESFEKKIESLTEVWKSIGELDLAGSDILHVVQIMDWAKLHALNIVLTAEWKDHKAKYEAGLLQEIEKAQNELLKLNSNFFNRCQKLADVVKNPWEDPILVKLLSSKEATIGPEEIEFFCVETAYLVSVRLKKLCESQCEDLALNLVTAFMNCNKLSKTQHFSLNATETQMWFIFDIHVALLYKFQENQKIVALLKELSLEEGLHLIRRFAKKRVKISKIWKHCHRIAVLASQVFVSTAAVKFSEEHREVLENLVEVFISICNTDALMENFTNSLRRISQLADAAGLYVFCDVIHRQVGHKLKPFTIEMYIRALTTDMNNLERQKNDNETEKVAETTMKLANAFGKLAELLDEHVKVARECVLTAFSLEPTQERLKKIEDLAVRSGFEVLDTGQDWKCKLHPPVLPSDDIAWTCPACGDWMCKPQLNVSLNTNTALNEALTTGDLGISPQLCDDLVVCVSNPRYQVLSWLLDWVDLHRLCVMYLNDPERTKNIVTELKFVDIDYNIFKGIKREPVDELTGIERGYEQYLDHDFASDDQMSTLSEDSASQESRPYSLGSDGAGDPYLSLPQPKSDPNTLKSLRMFRPNLKRSKALDPGQTIPEKIYKGDKVQTSKPHTSTSYHTPSDYYRTTLPYNDMMITYGPSHSGATNQPILHHNMNEYQELSLSLSNNIPSNLQNHPYNLSTTVKDDSKNGLVATLSPPGGQVATKETMQQNQNLPLPKNLQPGLQLTYTTQTISQSTKQDLMNALQNRSLQNGTPGSSNKHSLPPPKDIPKSQIKSGQKLSRPSRTIIKPRKDIINTSKTNSKDLKMACPPPMRIISIDRTKDPPMNGQKKCQNSTSKTEMSQPPVKSTTNNIKCQLLGIKLVKLEQDVNLKSKYQLDMLQGISEEKQKVPVHSNHNSKGVAAMEEHMKKQEDSFSNSYKVDQTNKIDQKTGQTKEFRQTCYNKKKEHTITTQTKPSPNNSPVGHGSLLENMLCNRKGVNVQDLIDRAMSAICSGDADSKLVTRVSDCTPWSKETKIETKALLKELLSNEFPKDTKQDSKEVCQKVAQKVAVSCSNDKSDNESKVDSNLPLPCNNNCDLSTVEKENRDHIHYDDLPKNLKMTEHKYSNNNIPVENKDCVRTLSQGDEKLLNICKNVNSNAKLCTQEKLTNTHSFDVHSLKHAARESSLKELMSQPKPKELKVILCRLSSTGKVAKESYPSCRSLVSSFDKKCDRGNVPPKCGRRRKSNCNDKSENNKHEQAPKRVQNYKLSPLLDINPRVPSTQKEEIKVIDEKIKNKNNEAPVVLNPRVILERLPTERRTYARSVLANVPGLNDFQMIRPDNVNHIVNVVQISGGRPTSNVPAQNTQTSTQVSPHIQRIGQPRTDKPEHTNTETSSTATSTLTSTTTTSVKPTTSQPSTLINILSQQMIRPGQSNCVRTRPSPLINILSQQIIRPNAPNTVQKITSNNSSPTEVQINHVSKTPASSEQQVTTTTCTIKNSTTPAKNTTTSATGQGTILQFICKSTLPKFQQAFGKSVYQNSTDSPETTATTTAENATVDANKKTTTTTVKNVPVNVPIQGGVIYTRQMPVGQTINLIPPGRQVFRIATSNSDQISLVKDTVIHSKMSALLAAALQGKPKTTTASTSDSQPESTGDASSDDSSGARVTVTRPTLVQNARIVKPLLQIPSNVIRTSPQSNLSSTTLEQLREFDMVYKQIKERSSTSTPSESNAQAETSESPSRISVTYVNQGQKYTQLSPVVVVSSSYCNLQPAASPALSVTSQGSSSPCVTPAPTPTVPKVATKPSKGKSLKSTTTHTSKSSPIPKPQQKPQEDEHTTQRIFDILAEYAEQLRNSPDLNNKPAPRRRSNPPTNPSQNSKRKKSSGSKKSGQSSSMVSDADTDDQRTMGSEDSSCGVVQLSVPEEEQPQSSVTTTEVTDNTNNTTTTTSRQLILTDSNTQMTRNLIIADSSVGEALKMPNTAVLVPGNYIMPVSMVKGGQQIAVVSGGSKILATVPARSGPNMLLFQSFLNQNRKSGVPTVKYSTIQPLSGISSQSLAGVSAQPPVILPPNSHNLTAVTLGQPLTLKKIDDSQNTELLLTISQPRDSNKPATETNPQPDSSTNVSNDDVKLDEPVMTTESSTEKVYTYQKSIISAPIATPVIAQTSVIKEEIAVDDNSENLITMDITPENLKEDSKSGERVQSVLVTACTSNGPMLSHTPPRYRKPSESTNANNDISNKEEFLHNGERQNNNEQKFQTNTVYYSNKNKKNAPQRLDRELHQLTLQRKQAALERELRLQKSLSEECEDLGVDEPSTSELFPEADLLFDSNHSPSFDQSQDLLKRPAPEIKDESKPSTMTLFSDDENSSSLRTDIFEYVEYRTVENDLEFDRSQQLTNGNESGSSCEDNTLLQNCASMSDVTLNSPISPDLYTENTPHSLNKYKFKYSNRKKGERQKPTETWTEEVSSSEDTTGSTELVKSGSHSPEPCSNKRSHSISCDDELSDGSYKVVRVAISKTDLLKDEESSEELHCDDDLDSPSGRGARRSVKKTCSCCNGSSQEGGSRKRPTSRPHTPAPHKKAFLNKKR